MSARKQKGPHQLKKLRQLICEKTYDSIGRKLMLETNQQHLRLSEEAHILLQQMPRLPVLNEA